MQGLLVASRLRDLRRFRFAAAGAAVVLVAVLAAQAIQPPGAPTGSPPSGSSPSTSSGTASQGPTGTQPAAQWQPLDLLPYSPVADLTADRSSASGVAGDTTFTLRSHTSASAVDLARGLVSSPSVDLHVAPGATADVATLSATTRLTDGARYRFRLNGLDGALIGSWSFRVAGPLHVTGLLPDDRTVGVPTTTGIEVTFDQDGVTGFDTHFTITPAVAGRFEQHERTWVFVPLTSLAPGTLYTYTVRAGVQQAGSTETLEQAVTASFETVTSQPTETSLAFDRALFDVRTGARPLLGLWVGLVEGTPAPTSLPIRLYRLPTIDAAAAAAAKLNTQDDWLLGSEAGLVDIAGLTQVGSFAASLTDPANGNFVMHVPAVLDPGWYLLVVPRNGRDAQTVLQVTDLATYAVSSFTRTLAWVNDLSAGTAIRDASIAIAGGPELGRTDGNGLLDTATPALLLTPADDWQRAQSHVLTIRPPAGRAAIAVLGLRSQGHYPYNYLYEWTERQSWWSIFATDRQTYRATDTIHAYGFVRSREDRSVPGSLTLQLGPTEGTWQPIVTRTVTPTARGSFVADVPIRELPINLYQLRLYAGTALVATEWLSVDVIRKPAYSIAVTTDHHAYVAGQTIRVSAAVTFYDGTTTPGLDLNVGRWDPDQQALVDVVTRQTDARGMASSTIRATTKGPDGLTDISLRAVPTHPEEGTIEGEGQVFVFPSKVWVAGTGEVRDGRLRLSGTVSTVDFAGLDRQLEDQGWPDNPAGTGIAGKALSVKVIHLVPVRKLVRTEYDYIEKQAVPIYEYDTREVVVGTYQVKSGSGGKFALSVAVPAAADSYRAIVTTRDADGRLSQATVEVWSETRLGKPSDLHLEGPRNAAPGQTIDLSIARNDGKAPVGTFLFIVGRDGIRDVVLTKAPALRRTYADADLPGFMVRAVRLSATGLEDAGDWTVGVDPASRRLTVTLMPDRSRYAPGDSVTIGIRTTGPDGRPTAADVVVRAIDQKLYAIGAVWDPDPLFQLMTFHGGGFVQAFQSAFAPSVMSEGDGYGGGAGGIRADFEDLATFQRVSTDASGTGRVTFTLPDDLTSWHVSATAFTGSLEAGDGVAIVPVGLPIFAEAVLAPDYLVGEAPVLRVRAYGESLHAGDPVVFTISAPTLGLAPRTIKGVAFEATRVPLPALPAGDHRVQIAVVRVGDPSLRDDLVRTVHVIPNRLTMLRTTYQDVVGVLDPPTGVGTTTYLVTDAGRGALLPILRDIAAGSGARFDRLAAAEAARAILATSFELATDGLPPTGFDEARYRRSDAYSVLPYASGDLSLAAKAAFTVPEQISISATRGFFTQKLDQAREADLPRDPNAEPIIRPTRLELIIAQAGRAALGDDVLDELRVLATTEPALSVNERLWLALGYLASGDENAARQIERDVLATSATQLGPWVRLDAGTPNEIDGLMLVLASGLGDPVAARISRYLIDRPSVSNLYALEQVGYVRAMLDRLPRAAGSFAWTVDGRRTVERLEPGGSWTVQLTPEQQRSFRLERLDGALALTTAAVVAAAAADLPSTPGLTITRSVSPASGAAEDQVVHVTIRVTFRLAEQSGSYTVSDLVPSGLAPIVQTAGWSADESGTPGLPPFEAAGQRVSWSISPSHNEPLVYSARVVTPGTYTWEPAVVQYDPDPTVGAATAKVTYTIR